MLMSEGYLANGKTILCKASDADRYRSLADIDKLFTPNRTALFKIEKPFLPSSSVMHSLTAS